MDGIPNSQLIGGILIYLAKFLVVIASFIALTKKRNIGSVLMLVGSLSIIFFDFLGIFLLANASRTGPEEVLKYNGINSIISAITYIIFGIGLLLYVLNNPKRTIREK